MAYYKVRMLDVDHLDISYHVYLTAFNKIEAREAVRYELLEVEQEDVIDAITEISEEEYLKKREAFIDGERS